MLASKSVIVGVSVPKIRCTESADLRVAPLIELTAMLSDDLLFGADAVSGKSSPVLDDEAESDT